MFAASIQGEGVLAKNKSQSRLDTMRARFPTGELIHGHGFCVLDLAPNWPEWEPGLLHPEQSPIQ